MCYRALYTVFFGTQNVKLSFFFFLEAFQSDIISIPTVSKYDVELLVYMQDHARESLKNKKIKEEKKKRKRKDDRRR